MWDADKNRFCDGVCSQVHNASLVMTNMFFLAFGLVPPAHAHTAWDTVTVWGIENIGRTTTK